MFFKITTTFHDKYTDEVTFKTETTFVWAQALGAFMIYANEPDCTTCKVENVNGDLVLFYDGVHYKES